MPSSQRPALAKSDNAKSVTLTEKDLKDATRLLKLFADSAIVEDAFSGFAATGADTQDRQLLISRAKMELGGRRARERYFHRDLFGEPAWEILLSLYISEESGARITTTKLAEFIATPLSTVVRWIRALEEKSLIGRVNHPTDRRIVFIRLLDKGRQALDDYFGAIPS